MKKIVVFILITCICFALMADSMEEGRIDAEQAANRDASSTIWGLIGFGSGCLLSGVGCLGSTLIAFLITPQLPAAVMNKSSEYIMSYKDTYVSTIKQKRALASFIGGSIATVIGYGLYYFLVLSAAATTN